MPKVVVIGAGVMGLAAAFQALLDGYEVDILEASTEPGGMAAHFDFGGISIERFYHFVCKTDLPTFELLTDLGIADKMRWVATTMGFFNQGKLHPWGDPISLMKLPGISLRSKLRYGFFAFVCTHRDRWPALENQVGKGMDYPFMRAGHLRPILASALTFQVLRVCRQHLGRMDLDPDPTRWKIAKKPHAGGARLYRRRVRRLS